MLLQIAEILLSPTASVAPVIMSLILRSYIGKALQEKIDCSEALIYSTKKTICYLVVRTFQICFNWSICFSVSLSYFLEYIAYFQFHKIYPKIRRMSLKLAIKSHSIFQQNFTQAIIDLRITRLFRSYWKFFNAKCETFGNGGCSKQ